MTFTVSIDVAAPAELYNAFHAALLKGRPARRAR
jgi:hypothetical protein